MQDYGCAIKLNDGGMVYEQTVRLLNVFMLFDTKGSREYQRSIACHLRMLNHWSRSNHPLWDVFKKNPCAFNEEVGEVSFSVLSRHVSHHSDRSNVTAVSAKYRLSRAIMQVTDDFKEDGLISPDDAAAQRRIQIDVNGREVRATAEHFSKVIRDERSISLRKISRILSLISCLDRSQ